MADCSGRELLAVAQDEGRLRACQSQSDRQPVPSFVGCFVEPGHLCVSRNFGRFAFERRLMGDLVACGVLPRLGGGFIRGAGVAGFVLRRQCPIESSL